MTFEPTRYGVGSLLEVFLNWGSVFHVESDLDGFSWTVRLKAEIRESISRQVSFPENLGRFAAYVASRDVSSSTKFSENGVRRLVVTFLRQEFPKFTIVEAQVSELLMALRHVLTRLLSALSSFSRGPLSLSL